MNTYRITFEITSNYPPNGWDWESMLKPEDGESYSILNIEEVGK